MHVPCNSGLTPRFKVTSQLFMISKHLFPPVAALLLVTPASYTRAQAQVTFDILLTYDYPGASGTSPRGLNDLGDVVGGFTNNEFYSNGFIRFHNGDFSDPIIDPNDTTGSTVLQGINNVEFLWIV